MDRRNFLKFLGLGVAAAPMKSYSFLGGIYKPSRNMDDVVWTPASGGITLIDSKWTLVTDVGIFGPFKFDEILKADGSGLKGKVSSYSEIIFDGEILRIENPSVMVHLQDGETLKVVPHDPPFKISLR